MLLFQATIFCSKANQRHISAHSLAEDKGEVVLGLFLMAQVLETQSFQEAEQTLIIYSKLISCQKEKVKTQNLTALSANTLHEQCIKACSCGEDTSLNTFILLQM